MTTVNPNGLLEGEEADIRKEARSVVPDSDRWLARIIRLESE